MTADVKIIDRAEVRGVRETSDGFLVADAIVARVGIQSYSASEMGLIDRDGSVSVYRPEDEVKAPASVLTYSHAPVTMDHPAELVTAENWKDLAIGEVSTEARWENGTLRLPLVIKDAQAIADIKAGKRELSAGYTCRIDWTDGVSPSGEAYEAVQRDIKINHVAVVERGRAGVARIGDAEPWGAAPLDAVEQETKMSDALQNVAFLGDAYSLNNDGVKLKAAADAAILAAEKEAAEAKAAEEDEKDKVKAKDAEIATLKKQLEDAKVTPAVLDAAIASRAETIRKAKALDMSEEEMEGMSEEEIQAMSVKKKMGDAAKDWTASQVKVSFDTLTADMKPNKALDGSMNKSTATTSLSAAYDARNQRLADSWKAKGGAA